MILSFHPLVIADQNILCAGRKPGQAELSAIQEAQAVILPQACRKSLYRMAKKNCAHVFPDYDARFAYPEKIGQFRLFQKTAVPHPRTIPFEHGIQTKETCQALLKNPPLKMPFVFKFNWGGGGDTVFFIQTRDKFQSCLKKALSYEKSGQSGFLLQEFIPAKGRSLRVVVVHQSYIAYWRIQDDTNDFYTNLAKGAKIDMGADPILKDAAIAATQRFCEKTRINLAGLDILFSQKDIDAGTIKPLFLEINYFFGRKGLGGSKSYYRLLQNEIDAWCAQL